MDYTLAASWLRVDRPIDAAVDFIGSTSSAALPIMRHNAHSSDARAKDTLLAGQVCDIDWPLVPPYRASQMSTAGDCPETRGLLVWVERIGCDGAICAVPLKLCHRPTRVSRSVCEDGEVLV